MSNSSSPRHGDDFSKSQKEKDKLPECSSVLLGVRVDTRQTLGDVEASDFKSLEIDCGESAGKTSECGTPGGPLSDCGNDHDGWSDAASSQRFSSPNPSEHEEGHGGERKPKRRRLHAAPSAEHGSSGTLPKTPTGRPIYPLSERQQMALLLQMTASDGGTPGDSPRSPLSTSHLATPSSAKSARGRTPRVHKRNEHGETPLHIAAIRGDYKLCRRLIKEGADVNCADYAGWAPLHEACNHGSYESAKVLLQHGANVNAAGLDNDTPLHDAASSNNLGICVLLLRHGADSDRTNAKNERPSDVVALDEEDGPLLRDILAGKIPWKLHMPLDEPRMSEEEDDEAEEREVEDDEGNSHPHKPGSDHSAGSDERHSTSSPGQPKASKYRDKDRSDKNRDKPPLEKKHSQEKDTQKKHKRRHVKVHSSKAHDSSESSKHQKLTHRKSGEGCSLEGRERDEKRRVSLDFSVLATGDRVNSGDESSNDVSLASLTQHSVGSSVSAETGSNSGFSEKSEKEHQIDIRKSVATLEKESEKKEKGEKELKESASVLFSIVSNVKPKPAQALGHPSVVQTMSASQPGQDTAQSPKVKLIRPPRTDDGHSKIQNLISGGSTPSKDQPSALSSSTPLSSLTKFKERENLLDKRPDPHQCEESEKSDREHKKQLSFKERMEDKKKKPAPAFLLPSRVTAGATAEQEKAGEKKSRKKDIYEFHSSDSDDGSPHPTPTKFAKSHKGQQPSALAKERPAGSTCGQPLSEPKRKFLIDCPAALNIRAPVFPIRKSTDAVAKRLSSDSTHSSASSSGFTSPKTPSAGIPGKGERAEGKFKFLDRKPSVEGKEPARCSPASVKPFKKIGQGFADKEAIRKQVLSSSLQRASGDSEKKSPVVFHAKDQKPPLPGLGIAIPERKRDGSATPTMMSPKLPETPKPVPVPAGDLGEKTGSDPPPVSDNLPPPRVPPLRIVFPPSHEPESSNGGAQSTPPSASVLAGVQGSSGATGPEVKGQGQCATMPYVVPGQGEEDTKETRLTRSKVKQLPPTPKRGSDTDTGNPGTASTSSAQQSGSMKAHSMPLRKRRAYGAPPEDSDSNVSGGPAGEKVQKLSKEDDPSVQAARNSLEGYYDLKKQLMKRWTLDSKNEEVDYKAPANFDNFMINKKNYLIFDKLENSQSRAQAPPASMHDRLKELYRSQESERHSLRQRQQAEREHLRLLCEKEVMRVHARASRAAAGKLQPALSFCRIIFDQDVYNPCVLDKPPPQDVEAKERCSPEQLTAWVQETISRFRTRKSEMLIRQRLEALSMHATQQMEFKAKIRILRMTTSNTLPEGPDCSAVPPVSVPDDFDLVPPDPDPPEGQPPAGGQGQEQKVVAA